MTHTSTEQERAEFEAWAQARGLETVRLRSNRPHTGEYFWQQVQDAWCIWQELQAARRAPVVPQFSRVAKTKLNYLLEAGEAITGYAIENKDGRRGAIDCHGFVYWWQTAAAPQTPEANSVELHQIKNAAPVLMPEPIGELLDSPHDDDGLISWYTENRPPVGSRLYTEQQVRQLLANHASAKR